MNSNAWLAACLAALLAFAPFAARAAAGDDLPPAEDTACGLSGGALTVASADNGDGDFAVFGLYDANGERVARQYVPIYNPDASAELMLTPIGSGETIASAKCLAETSLQRCPDPKWVPVDDGAAVSLIGFLLGDDFAVVSVRVRYKSATNGSLQPLDGTAVGFEVDKDPIRWSSLFNSQDQASQAFFDMPSGTHDVTIGTRDPESGSFLPQDRVCFKT